VGQDIEAVDAIAYAVFPYGITYLSGVIIGIVAYVGIYLSVVADIAVYLMSFGAIVEVLSLYVSIEYCQGYVTKFFKLRAIAIFLIKLFRYVAKDKGYAPVAVIGVDMVEFGIDRHCSPELEICVNGSVFTFYIRYGPEILFDVAGYGGAGFAHDSLGALSVAGSLGVAFTVDSNTLIINNDYLPGAPVMDNVFRFFREVFQDDIKGCYCFYFQHYRE
jgi:hypothetical protein